MIVGWCFQDSGMMYVHSRWRKKKSNVVHKVFGENRMFQTRKVLGSQSLCLKYGLISYIS